MDTDDEFAQWATLFSRGFRESEAAARSEHPAPNTPGVEYSGVTRAAGELLRAVDAGGIPAFVTTSLKQLAADNGIDVPIEWTPNEIIDAIRDKATADGPSPAMSSAKSTAGIGSQ